MSEGFQSGKVVCLLDSTAQCNPIWVSDSNGLSLAHFQSFEREPREQRDVTGYEGCERHCLPRGGRPVAIQLAGGG